MGSVIDKQTTNIICDTHQSIAKTDEVSSTNQTDMQNVIQRLKTSIFKELFSRDCS
ncbi:MAG: hypothetical protein ACJAS9_003018 [Polaribacter sp.]|jgi:hypothetical protein